MCYITRDIARVLFYVNYLRWIRGYRAVSFVFRARLNEKQKRNGARGVKTSKSNRDTTLQ